MRYRHTVVILNGNWRSASQSENAGERRRLYYVAMTRAGKTLSLAKTGDSNPFLRVLHDHHSVLVRSEPECVAPEPQELGVVYYRLSLRDVQLSFAGYRPPEYAVQRAIAGLSLGDPLQVRTYRSPRELATVDDITAGRLAQGCRVPAETGDVSASVLVIAAWDKAKSEGRYHDWLKSEHWEVVIPEIVTAVKILIPQGGGHRRNNLRTLAELSGADQSAGQPSPLVLYPAMAKKLGMVSPGESSLPVVSPYPHALF